MTTHCLYDEAWWLDATAPGAWGASTVARDGRVVGRMPYVRSRWRGLPAITMPPLTQTLGPWMAYSSSKYASQRAEEKDVYQALLDALPPHDWLELRFHAKVTNWLPFHFRGCTQTTRYTYVFDDITQPEALWKDFQTNIRTDIKKAEKLVVVREDVPMERILEGMNLTFARQGRRMPHSRELLLRIDAAARARDARLAFAAEDTEGRLHAVAYFVFDERCAYYLLGGGDPDLRRSGASSLLIWRALQSLSGRTARFDFEGSMIEGIERFFRAFGARQTPYFQVRWANPRGRAVELAAETAKLTRDQALRAWATASRALRRG